MLVKIEQLEKQYPNFHLDCSMEVRKGQITGLIGQNGAGKSTTFKALLNLIAFDKGRIEVFGKSYREITTSDKNKIGVVLSDSGFSNYITVKDVIRIMKGFYPEFDEEEFKRQCEHFRLPMNDKIKTFSTGMKAKLKILAAMSHGARLLILDEPTAGLDVVVRDEILDMLRTYMMEEDRGILISSHIATDLEGLCDDIYLIDEGKITLHEDIVTLTEQYGLLKLDEAHLNQIDQTYILAKKKEHFGVICLTNEKQFYQENYPDIVIEKCGIDDVIYMTAKGVGV